MIGKELTDWLARTPRAAVTIGPHRFAVRKRKDLATAGAYGLCSTDDLLIAIDQDLVPSLQMEAFCHELAEAANSLQDLGLHHWQIQALGMVFSQALSTLEVE